MQLETRSCCKAGINSFLSNTSCECFQCGLVYTSSSYQVKEVYYYQEPNSTPQVIDILLLISGHQIKWAASRYTCRLVFEIDWNTPGLGLKMPSAEYIPTIRGRLEEKDSEFVLWWESYGSAQSLGSTLRLHASRQFSKEELIKIAASTESLR